MINLKGRRVALIGGAGFIGHNLALSLQKQGAEVSVIDSLSVNNLLNFYATDVDITTRELYVKIINQRINLLKQAKIPVTIQDARDYHGLSQALTRTKPQVIVHLAAVAHANRSNKDPFSTFDHSLRTLENALDNARGKIEHFIYFSSSMVYGNFPDGFATEETPCNPIGIYGALKFAGEKMVIAYNQVYGLPYTIIRPSALYGARCVSRRVGQIFIENALSDSGISVSGKGDDRLDFTYIDDLVQGVHKTIENPNSLGQIFNITHGNSAAIADMVAILGEHFPKVKLKYTQKDSLMPDRGTLSVEKARKLIGYEPQFPLSKGFPRYIGWYKEFLQGSGSGQALIFPDLYE